MLLKTTAFGKKQTLLPQHHSPQGTVGLKELFFTTNGEYCGQIKKTLLYLL